MPTENGAVCVTLFAPVNLPVKSMEPGGIVYQVLYCTVLAEPARGEGGL